MNVPVLELMAISARHAAEMKATVDRVIKSGRHMLGEEVKAFEPGFASWVDTSHRVVELCVKS